MPKQCSSGMISIGGILGSNDVSENRGVPFHHWFFPIKNDQFGMSLAPFQNVQNALPMTPNHMLILRCGPSRAKVAATSLRQRRRKSLTNPLNVRNQLQTSKSHLSTQCPQQSTSPSVTLQPPAQRLALDDAAAWVSHGANVAC